MKQIRYDPIYKNIQCYCSKRQTIQLGWDFLLYLNPIVLIIFVVFSIFSLFALFVAPIGWYNLIFPGFTVIFIYVLRLDYQNCFRDMRKAGHSVACSKKVARSATWRQYLYSDYEIDVEIIDAPSRQEHNTASIIILLWMITIAVNLFFIHRFAAEDAASMVYPALFVFSIITSTALILKMRARNKWLIIVCVLNIISSCCMMSLYGLKVMADML